MKKLISMTLVAAMALTMGACSAKKETTSSGTATTEVATTEAVANNEVACIEAASEAATEQVEASSSENKVHHVGVLTMLNLTENEMLQYRDAEAIAGKVLTDEGYFQMDPDRKPKKMDNQLHTEIIFYDSLDAMLMALNARDIDELSVYYKTGQYLCATNDNLELLYTINADVENKAFAELVLTGNMSNDFAFLMMDDKEALRDEFNNAIGDMKADGTMDKLINEQIEALVNGTEVKSVTMPVIEDTETVKVAVTGALPPMDYVAADGTPAGFNTAVLAEISQRIGKNIELVVVDSIGRATALSSGTVDAVFWTRTNEMAAHYAEMSEEEKEAEMKKYEAEMNDDEIEAFNKIREILNFENYNSADMPEGTICTVPYYSDILVPVKKKS